MRNHQDICKAWAQGSTKSMRGFAILTNGEGRIYSYGYHYIMGQIHETAAGRVALINSEGYSVSTAKHTSYCVRAVVHEGLTYYMVPNVTSLYAPENYAKLEADVEEAKRKHAKARQWKQFWAKEIEKRMDRLCVYLTNYPRQEG